MKTAPATPFSTRLSGNMTELKMRFESILRWKKQRPPMGALALAICIGILLSSMVGCKPLEELHRVDVDEVLSEEGFHLSGLEPVILTLTVPKEVLSAEAYTHEGREFAENEVIVYQSETSSIYLTGIMQSNEEEDTLYFLFDYSYNLPEQGVLLTPFKFLDGKLEAIMRVPSTDLTSGGTVYENAVSIRGIGPSNMFALHVSADACRDASEALKLQAWGYPISYYRE